MNNIKKVIARRVAKELNDGDLVNLGIGIPSLVADYIPEKIEVFLQGENGVLGLGPQADKDNIDPNLTNPSGQYSTIKENGVFFDTSLSFLIIRGGHIDLTVLGTLEVDAQGSIASWIIPNKMVPGMGGSMDLVTGAKRVIIATTHTNKGKPKIKQKCTLPLTAYGVVDLIVTEMAVMKVEKDGLHLIERHPEFSIQDIIEATDAKLVYDKVKIMEV